MTARYKVRIKRSAEKELTGISKKDRRRLIAAIRELVDEPRPANAKPLVGRPAWRLRVGRYRVIYTIEDDLLVVMVIRVGHRRDVYR